MYIYIHVCVCVCVYFMLHGMLQCSGFWHILSANTHWTLIPAQYLCVRVAVLACIQVHTCVWMCACVRIYDTCVCIYDMCAHTYTLYCAQLGALVQMQSSLLMGMLICLPYGWVYMWLLFVCKYDLNYIEHINKKGHKMQYVLCEVFLWVYVYLFLYVCMCVCVGMCMCICVYVCGTCVCMCVGMCMCVCVWYMRVHVCRHVYVCIACMYVCMYICMCVWMCVCVCCAYVVCMCAVVPCLNIPQLAKWIIYELYSKWFICGTFLIKVNELLFVC